MCLFVNSVLVMGTDCHDNASTIIKGDILGISTTSRGARFARPLLVPVFICMYYLIW